MPISGKDAIKRLCKDGWEVDRQNGSHCILKKNNDTIVIPIHKNTDLPKGLLKNIEKKTKIKF